MPAAARRLLLPILLAAALPAWAEERPGEEDLFGAPAAALPATETPPAVQPPSAPTSDERAADLLGASRVEASTGRWDKEKEDPLKVGGLLYLRASTTWQRGVPLEEWPLSTPALLDLYLDSRPNDRVRGFVLGRLTYQPTLPTETADLLGRPQPQAQTRAVLDQLYVNFDVERTVFVTAGRQHAKWGTGRFWNPGDFLHPARKSPLAQFDDRTGVTMVKAHLPWEARGWNLYGVALLENLSGSTTSTSNGRDGTRLGTLGGLGGAARAEVVLGSVEAAASVAAQAGIAPRYGLDTSFALWDLDLHGELALVHGRDAPTWRPTGLDPATLAGWVRTEPGGTTAQAVGGVEWSWKYSDEDSLTLGGEYFYNGAGYHDPHVYPVLLASPYLSRDPRAAFTPFYLGRHYAGAWLSAPRPGRWNDTTFTLSALANLSDGSGLVRFDHAVLLNTYLTLETFLAGHLGHQGGEFRFGLTVRNDQVGGILGQPAVSLPTPVVDAGVALRVKL